MNTSYLSPLPYNSIATSRSHYAYRNLSTNQYQANNSPPKTQTSNFKEIKYEPSTGVPSQAIFDYKVNLVSKQQASSKLDINITQKYQPKLQERLPDSTEKKCTKLSFEEEKNKRMQEQIKQQQQQIQQLEAQKQNEINQYEQLKYQLDQVTTESDQLKQEISNKNDQLHKYEQLKNQFDKLTIERNQLNQEISNKNDQLFKLQIAIQNSYDNQKLINQLKDQHTQEKITLRKTYEQKYQQQEQSYLNQIGNLKKINQDHEQQKQKEQKQILKQLEDQNKQKDQELQQLKDQIEQKIMNEQNLIKNIQNNLEKIKDNTIKEIDYLKQQLRENKDNILYQETNDLSSQLHDQTSVCLNLNNDKYSNENLFSIDQQIKQLYQQKFEQTIKNLEQKNQNLNLEKQQLDQYIQQQKQELQEATKNFQLQIEQLKQERQQLNSQIEQYKQSAQQNKQNYENNIKNLKSEIEQLNKEKQQLDSQVQQYILYKQQQQNQLEETFKSNRKIDTLPSQQKKDLGFVSIFLGVADLGKTILMNKLFDNQKFQLFQPCKQLELNFQIIDTESFDFENDLNKREEQIIKYRKLFKDYKNEINNLFIVVNLETIEIMNKQIMNIYKFIRAFNQIISIIITNFDQQDENELQQKFLKFKPKSILFIKKDIQKQELLQLLQKQCTQDSEYKIDIQGTIFEDEDIY